MQTEEAFERAKATLDARMQEMGGDLKAVADALGIDTDVLDLHMDALTALALASADDLLTKVGGLTRVVFILGHEVGRLEREG